MVRAAAAMVVARAAAARVAARVAAARVAAEAEAKATVAAPTVAKPPRKAERSSWGRRADPEPSQ